MKIRAFITHKQAELFADCQDRFSVSNDTKSIAVSDGMGSTWQQKIWAQLLVETFTQEKEWKPCNESVKSLSPIWRKKVEEFIQELKDNNKPNSVIFRNERYLVQGHSAGATFVGIRFDGINWNGTVLGDSCLIDWDGKNAIFHTSQEVVDSFDSYPDYFDSDDSKEGRGIPKDISGTMKQGTCLFLVSDPFSDFLWEHKKQGDISTFICQLLSIQSHESFEELVEDWRKLGMPNDDTTLVIIEPDESAELNILYEDNLESMKKTEQAELDAKANKENEKSSVPDKCDISSNEDKTLPVHGELQHEMDNKNVCSSESDISEDDSALSLAREKESNSSLNTCGVSSPEVIDKELLPAKEQFKKQVISLVFRELDKRPNGKLSQLVKHFSKDEKGQIKTPLEKALDKALKEYDVIKKRNSDATT